MLISEIKELPLRYQDHAGPKSQKFTSLFDLKVALTANWGVYKRKMDETKIQYFITKTGKVAGYWNGFDQYGMLYKK